MRRQGLAVLVAVTVWGASIAVFGLVPVLWFGLFMLAVAGAADMVSAVFRSTILQTATPDALRGRLQGVFVVVVAGGPRLGDVESGTVASVWSERCSIVSGGLLCIVGVAVLAMLFPSFARYRAPVAGRSDARPRSQVVTADEGEKTAGLGPQVLHDVAGGVLSSMAVRPTTRVRVRVRLTSLTPIRARSSGVTVLSRDEGRDERDGGAPRIRREQHGQQGDQRAERVGHAGGRGDQDRCPAQVAHRQVVLGVQVGRERVPGGELGRDLAGQLSAQALALVQRRQLGELGLRRALQLDPLLLDDRDPGVPFAASSA